MPQEQVLRPAQAVHASQLPLRGSDGLMLVLRAWAQAAQLSPLAGTPQPGAGWPTVPSARADPDEPPSLLVFSRTKPGEAAEFS